MKRVDRFACGGSYRVETDGELGYYKRRQGAQQEEGRAQIDSDGELLKPPVHPKPANGPGDEDRDADEQQELA